MAVLARIYTHTLPSFVKLELVGIVAFTSSLATLIVTDMIATATIAVCTRVCSCKHGIMV